MPVCFCRLHRQITKSRSGVIRSGLPAKPPAFLLSIHILWIGQSEGQGTNWLLSFQTMFTGNVPPLPVGSPYQPMCSNQGFCGGVVPAHPTCSAAGYRLERVVCPGSGCSPGMGSVIMTKHKSAIQVPAARRRGTTLPCRGLSWPAEAQGGRSHVMERDQSASEME